MFAFVKRVGKESIVERWITKLSSVFLIVLVTELSISSLKLALAKPDGPATIVLKVQIIIQSFLLFNR